MDISLSESAVLILEKYSLKNPGKDGLLIATGSVFLTNKDGRYSMENKRFTIKNVKRTDTGIYECRYQHNGEKISISHTLDVHFAPSVRPKQKTIPVTKGDTTTLSCRVLGNPAPKVMWSKDNGVMRSGAQEEEALKIELTEVTRHDAGVYTCTAENGIGSPASGVREIIVSYPPEIRTENVSVDRQLCILM